MKPKISIITLGVRDLAKSLAFYRDGLGFAAHNHTEGQEHVMFQLEGSWLSLFPRGELAKDATVADDGQGFSGVTLAHNVGSKEEVDAVFSHAVSVGATAVKAAVSTDRAPGHSSAMARRIGRSRLEPPTWTTWVTASGGRPARSSARRAPSATVSAKGRRSRARCSGVSGAPRPGSTT